MYRRISCLKNYVKVYSFRFVTPPSRSYVSCNFGQKRLSNFPVLAMAQSTTAAASAATNRLALEKSPYLLQHAHNPVDWYPWGNEAIAKAKKENKLIFLSVGYSTCHWCHVMEKESFENDAVAKIMNELFVNVKVDREERPDIDKIYMNFVTMMNDGAGGWPMSVWITPDLAPIAGGTYFPPEDKWGRPGFKTILASIAEKWKESGLELAQTGLNIIEKMQASAYRKERGDEDLSVDRKLMLGITIYNRNVDDEWGGYGLAPKFPQVSKINFCLHAHIEKINESLFSKMIKTLNHMFRGGIHDHVFGGFARYAVDRKWHIPHFEKMLYDQGQLLMAYSNAYKICRHELYLDICDDIFRYLCKDLQHPPGGFYSGEDADSLPTFEDDHKIEGAFYAWTLTEVENIFEKNISKFPEAVDSANLYCSYYGILDKGNVQQSDDPHGHLIEKNILRIRTSLDETADLFKTDRATVKTVLKVGNSLLHADRDTRPRPHLDTKIITAWNGLTLSGLSKLSCIENSKNQPEYLSVAKKQLEFIRTNLYNAETKTLLRSCYGDGPSSNVTHTLSDPIAGYLDDYAFLIKGLIDYYVATLDYSALRWARDLQLTQDELFWDWTAYGYFYSQAYAENVCVRLKEDHDGAEPSGNSITATNLQLLSEYFSDESLKQRAEQLFEYYNGVENLAFRMPELLSSFVLFANGLTSVIIVGPDNDETQNLIKTVRNYFIPGLVLIHQNTDNDENNLLTGAQADQYKLVNGKSTVYLCHNHVCQLPITNVADLKEKLDAKYTDDKCRADY